MGDQEDDIITIDEIKTDADDVVDDKPIMSILKHLVGNKGKQDTVITNAQVMDILKEEFHIEVNQIHELERDIYLNIMKRFLLRWPQWEELDRTTSKLRTTGDFKEIKRGLKTKYKSLKSYLQIIMDAAQPMVEQTIRNVEESNNKIKTNQKEIEANECLMEIYCTRTQLNQLILRRPNPLNQTIFNIKECPVPSRIVLKKPSYTSLLNLSSINIFININGLVIRRETVHKLNHTLVNKKLDQKTLFKSLDTNMQLKCNGQARDVDKDLILKRIDKNIESFEGTFYKDVISLLLNMMKKDLEDAPDVLKVPAIYRQNMSYNPYFRYLYTDLNSNNSDETYDLQLEEMIRPRYFIQLIKIDKHNNKNTTTVQQAMYPDKVRIECCKCEVRFCGVDILEKLEQHFNYCHNNHVQEPDWQCPVCCKSMPMVELSGQRWEHNCIVKE